MKLSEFKYAVATEFGDSYGRVVVRDLVLPRLGGRSAQQAIDDGVRPRDVWAALCEATDVPPERRSGVGLPSPRE
ncbi:DUF3046 domain-containing protein [Paramicrobacterium agarici]|uniref:DUF3046 family protein n=1 Tax=Paramicrobacterium agarici TaxID=630514 RepID=A0A2A9DYI5_9MICO|nr:DUF3046 domain-containing protein [Microbacterium agarici]PFG31042.1 Protein of unknown function (DUF3046) [Microbacterium agarici]